MYIKLKIKLQFNQSHYLPFRLLFCDSHRGDTGDEDHDCANILFRDMNAGEGAAQKAISVEPWGEQRLGVRRNYSGPGSQLTGCVISGKTCTGFCLFPHL